MTGTGLPVSELEGLSQLDFAAGSPRRRRFSGLGRVLSAGSALISDRVLQLRLDLAVFGGHFRQFRKG